MDTESQKAGIKLWDNYNYRIKFITIKQVPNKLAIVANLIKIGRKFGEIYVMNDT